MATGGRSVYVYYRVAHADLPRVVAAVQAMQARLCAGHPGLGAQLLRRVDAIDAALAARRRGEAAPSVTLMELYAAPPGVDGALQAEIEAAAAALPTAAVAGERHVELFEPCPALP